MSCLAGMEQKARVSSTKPEVLANPADSVSAERKRRIALAEASVHGGVILGRGANFVLRSRPNVLSVLLTGPRERRVQSVMMVETSTGGQPNGPWISMTRPGWGMYGAEREDPADYDLIIDSTAVDWDTIVNLIVEVSLAAPAGGHVCST